MKDVTQKILSDVSSEASRHLSIKLDEIYKELKDDNFMVGNLAFCIAEHFLKKYNAMSNTNMFKMELVRVKK